MRRSKKEIVLTSNKNHKVNQEQSIVDSVILRKFNLKPVNRRRGGIVYLVFIIYR